MRSAPDALILCFDNGGSTSDRVRLVGAETRGNPGESHLKSNLFQACVSRLTAMVAVVGSLVGGSLAAADPAETGRQLTLPEPPFEYRLPKLSGHLADVLASRDNTPEDNPITNAGATLGRVLFYDRTLSHNGTTSCGTCHLQSHGFAEPRPTSIGFDGRLVTRNSMSLVNLRFYPRGRFFWDERAATLEQQVLMPIENEIEMGHRLPDLVKQLQADPVYPPLFQEAFRTPVVSSDRIAKALAQFIRSMVSLRSRYDEGLARVDSPLKPFPNFTDEENLGKQQFFGRARCAECHLPKFDDDATRQWYVFQLDEPLNNGIDSENGPVDPGVGSVTGHARDRGRFKSSSLRNIAHTGPYMHDGRFHTLDQVIEHYNWSVRPHANLDARLRDFAANGLALPEVPKVALAKFLETLTDDAFLKDPRYSDPWVHESDVSVER